MHVDFADPVLNDRKILLFGPIDQRAAEVVIREFLYLDGKSHEPIDFYLKSPGGDMQYSFAIEQTMRLLRSRVNTYALSECNSGGAVLLAAGTGKRSALHGTMIVIHGIAFHGNKPPPVYTAGMQDIYTEFWRKHTRLPQSWRPLPFDSLHILTAEHALEYGVVDEVVGK